MTNIIIIIAIVIVSRQSVEIQYKLYTRLVEPTKPLVEYRNYIIIIIEKLDRKGHHRQTSNPLYGILCLFLCSVQHKNQ